MYGFLQIETLYTKIFHYKINFSLVNFHTPTYEIFYLTKIWLLLMFGGVLGADFLYGRVDGERVKHAKREASDQMDGPGLIKQNTSSRSILSERKPKQHHTT